MEKRLYSAIVLCNPLLDHICHVGDQFLDTIQATAGTMNLVDHSRFDEIQNQLGNYYVLPGGSGANTARGIAWLSGSREVSPAVYFGAVGNDGVGKHYEERLIEAGVVSKVSFKDSETGVSLVAVTPDSQRTMFTFLGACQLMSQKDFDFSLIADTSIFHSTGYMWDTKNQCELIQRAAVTSHSSGTLVSFDIADPFAAQRYGKDFLAWIPEHVNILFGNRDEFELLFGMHSSDEHIIAQASSSADIVVMKVGAKGAYVACDGEIMLSPGMPADVVDTTGAGDSFAAGFLYGLLHGRSPLECAGIGNRLAGAIVEVDGCDYGKLKPIEL
ncbi:MAG: adenosine kinase [Spirochaetales bacterium]|nr:adenosine kinase [Spirochaetales bacterium]